MKNNDEMEANANVISPTVSEDDSVGSPPEEERSSTSPSPPAVATSSSRSALAAAANVSMSNWNPNAHPSSLSPSLYQPASSLPGMPLSAPLPLSRVFTPPLPPPSAALALDDGGGTNANIDINMNMNANVGRTPPETRMTLDGNVNTTMNGEDTPEHERKKKRTQS